MYESAQFHPLPPQPKADASGLKWVMAGGLFVLLHIRVQGVDLLPDFIGYMFMTAGLRRMEPYSPRFRRAKLLAAAEIFISLLDIYQPGSEQGISLWGTIAAWTITPALTALSLLLAYHIIGGITDLARRSQSMEILAAPGRMVFGFKLLTGIAYVIVGGLNTLISYMLSPLIALTLISLVAEFVYLLYLRRAYRTLHGAVLCEPEDSPPPPPTNSA